MLIKRDRIGDANKRNYLCDFDVIFQNVDVLHGMHVNRATISGDVIEQTFY